MKLSSLILILSLLFVRLDAHEAQSSWIEKWIEGGIFFKSKDYQRAIDSFNEALNSISDESGLNSNSTELFQILYERGVAYSHLADHEMAINDFSAVIGQLDEKDPLVIHAWRSRFHSYGQLKNLLECEVHYLKLQAIDPTFPRIEYYHDYMVIRLIDAITDQQRDKISEVMQKVKICEDDPDVVKTPTGFCIVKFSDQFKSKMPCCDECFQSRCCTPQPPLEGTHYPDTASCSANCSSASYYAAALCAGITGNRCRMACIAAVEPLRRACDWCCSTGDFYSSCAAPLLSFFPPPCDPYWD